MKRRLIIPSYFEEEATMVHIPAKGLDNIIAQKDYLISELINARFEVDGYTPGSKTVDEIEIEDFQEELHFPNRKAKE